METPDDFAGLPEESKASANNNSNVQEEAKEGSNKEGAKNPFKEEKNDSEKASSVVQSKGKVEQH